jgi:chromosome segregation ATPase
MGRKRKIHDRGKYEIKEVSAEQDAAFKQMSSIFQNKLASAKHIVETHMETIKTLEAQNSKFNLSLNEKTQAIAGFKTSLSKTEADAKKAGIDLKVSLERTITLETSEAKLMSTLERERASTKVLEAQLAKAETEANQLSSDNVLQREELYNLGKKLEESDKSINMLCNGYDAAVTWAGVDACDSCKASFSDKILPIFQ